MIVDKVPSQLPKMETQLSLYAAIKFLKIYNQERKWLLANKVDFKDFKDEAQHKKFEIQFQLIDRAKRVHYTKCIQKAAEEIEKVQKRNTMETRVK